MVKRYKMGPIFTPPVVSSLDGPLATLQVPSDVGGANWPGGSLDPENNRLYIHSHSAIYAQRAVPANPAQSDMGYVAGPGARRRWWPASRRRRRSRRAAGRGGGAGAAAPTCKGCRS